MLFFLEVIQLLVVETNRYNHQYLDSLNDRQSPLPDVTLKEMYSFLALYFADRACHKGHTESVLDYSRTVQYTLFWKDKMTDSATYLDTFTSLTTQMNLKREMTILTDYER
jgi:hypothetical protein